jgi:ParB family chromosome partitioning protein
MQPREFTIAPSGLIIMNIVNPVKKKRRYNLPHQFLENVYAPQKRIDIQILASDQGLFRMSFGFDPGPLLESIREAGLLNPPVVYPGANGTVDIVCGYRRVFALKELGCTAVPCRVLPESLSRRECMLLNVYDNVATRGLNPVEKAMACRRLASLFPREEVLSRFMPTLGLPSHEPTLDLYTAIDAELDEPIKDAVASGRMPVKSVEGLLKFSNPDRTALCDVFSKLKFNVNQQLQLFDLISDITLRDQKTVAELTGGDPFKKILDDDAMNPPQKARAFLDRCRRFRYPQLYRAEKHFKSEIDSLRLPREVEIGDPEHFEPSEFKMQVRFKNGAHLKKVLQQLLGRSLEKLAGPSDGDSNDGI